MHIRNAVAEDLGQIKELYTQVTGNGTALARAKEEITTEYIENFLTRSIGSGLILVAEHPEKPGELIAEIHACNPGPAVFRHVYSDLTVVVHPSFQRKKIGRTIFMIFLEEIGLNRPHIGRVELITRESNLRGIKFYQSLGFVIEGRFEMRIKTPDGNYEADIPMAWQNPNFEFDS